ncbi:SMI1/KNR4 family protein [Candidatus Woesearchaeota archaeon]|nr:SMI1/KNR4 family protein [Candidatus Woesearchaeota archaeon]
MNFEKIVEVSKKLLMQFGEELQLSITVFNQGRVTMLDPSGLSKDAFVDKAREYIERELPEKYYVAFLARAITRSGNKEDVLTILEYSRDSRNRNTNIPYKIDNKKVTFGKPFECDQELHSIWNFYPAKPRNKLFRMLMGTR